MNIDTRYQWSNYWRQGHLTSLPCGFAANYDGEFLQFWNQQFTLLNKGDCVLDVCSGNGSIALLAQQYSDRRALALDVKSVDAADIEINTLIEKNPNIADQIRAIEFVSNTLLEEMTEESATVHLITSQYGIEYTDWQLSAENVNRLLKSGGYFSLICHSFDSKIMRHMEFQHSDYARLAGLDIFCREFKGETDLCDQRKVVDEFDHALDLIYAMFNENRASDVLSAVGGELEKIRRLLLQDFTAGIQQFSRFQQGVYISYATSSDLVAVSRKIKQHPDWFEVFSDAGMQLLQSGHINYHTGEKAGKYYQWRKPL